MFRKILMAFLLTGSIGLFAHEGHDQTPGALKANHGGVVKSGKQINLEYVVTGDLLSLYPATHEGTDLKPADVKLSATAKLPKGKAEPVKLEIKDGAYLAKVDFKGAYRVELQVIATSDGKDSTFKFQVEK